MSLMTRSKNANIQIRRTEQNHSLKTRNLRSDRSMFIVKDFTRCKKKETAWRRNRRRFLIVLSFWSIPAFLSGKGSSPFSPDWNCARFFRKVGYYRPTRRSCSEWALSKRVVLFRPLSLPRRPLHPLLGSLHLLFLPTFFFYYRPTLDVEMIFRGFAFPWRWYRTVRGINTDRLQPRP